MPISLTWDETHQSVVMTITQPWTLPDFDAAIAQFRRILLSRDTQAHLVLDARAAGFPPAGIMHHLYQQAQSRHPRLGMIVVVGSHTLARNLLGALQRVYPDYFKKFNFHFADSVEEAHLIISKLTMHV